MTQTKEELQEISEAHNKLCGKLHEVMDEIPKSVQDKIWDLVYSNYEP